MRRVLFASLVAAIYVVVRQVVLGLGATNAWLVLAYERGDAGLALVLFGGALFFGLIASRFGSSWRDVLAVVAGLEAGAYLLAIGQALAASVRPRPAFGSVFIPGGWRYVLVGYLGIALLLLVYSAVYIGVKNRMTRRKQSVWTFYGYALIHLFLISLVLLVFYPVIQVVAASFDPTNNLFSFRRVNSPFLLVRAKVLPDFSRISLENYQRLVDGVVIYGYQWALLAAAALALLLALWSGYKLRRLGPVEPWATLQGRALFVFALLAFLLVVLVSPSQFGGRSTESKFLLWVRNTLLLSSATGFLAVALTATAGYAFARFRFPGRYPLLLTFIFVQMFPGFLALIAIYYLLSALDLLNTFTGLLLAYSGGIISFGSWVYKGYIESLGHSLEEAAYIDGASRWQAFLRIILPLSAPIFVFIFLLQFVGTYSEFILANLVLTGVEKWTVGIGLYSFTTGQFSTKWGVFAAASVLGSLPILMVFYGFQQYFVSGYTAGAVKE